MLWGTENLVLLDVRQLETAEMLRVRVPPGLPLNSTLVVRHAPPAPPFVRPAPHPVAYAPPTVERAHARPQHGSVRTNAILLV